MRAVVLITALHLALAGSAAASDLPTPPAPPLSKVRAAALGIGGATVGLFAVALATSLVAQADFDTLDGMCGASRDRCPPGFEETRNRGLALQSASWGLTGAGVGGLIATVGMFLAPATRERGPAKRPLVLPLVVPSGGGVAATFRF